MASIQSILDRLRSWGSAENLAGMARYGISVCDGYGVPLGKLKPLAREFGV